jgi:hypothetical protein
MMCDFTNNEFICKHFITLKNLILIDVNMSEQKWHSFPSIIWQMRAAGSCNDVKLLMCPPVPAVKAKKK